jgi:hypothetical protein
MLRKVEIAILIAILAGYALVAALYAAQTPPWQAPDEPAHYNVAAQIAAGPCCPVIAMGDWDSPYLDELKNAKFHPDLTADLPTIQYEDHQPPLYYMLMALVYRLSDGSLTAMRLVSASLGIIVILCGYAMARITLPNRRGVALATAALLAFIPQHVAIISSVNNDALALPLVALGLLLCAHYLGTGRTISLPPRMRTTTLIACGVFGAVSLLAGGAVGWLLAALYIGAGFAIRSRRFDDATVYHVIMGLLLGTIFVTKSTGYFMAAVIPLAIVLRPIVTAARTPVAKAGGVALKVAGALGNIPIPGVSKTETKKAPETVGGLGRRFGWNLLKNARKDVRPGAAPAIPRHRPQHRRSCWGWRWYSRRSGGGAT